MHSPTFKQTCDKSHSCLQWHFKDCSSCNFPDGLQDTRTRLYHLFLLFLFRHVLLLLSFFFSHSRFSLSSLVHFPVGILSSVESVCREGRREGRREQGQSLTRELPPPPFAVRVCTTSVSCLLLSLSPSPFFHPSVREGLREGWTAGGREGLPRPPNPPWPPLSLLSLPSPLSPPLSPLLSPRECAWTLGPLSTARSTRSRSDCRPQRAKGGGGGGSFRSENGALGFLKGDECGRAWVMDGER